MAGKPHVIDLPHRRALLRHASKTILQVSLIPMGVFYAAYSLAGLSVAIGAALAWYYVNLAVKVLRGQRILIAMVIGAGLLTIRAITTLLTGSAVIYFLQPVAGTVATATAIAVTALAGRPMLDRIAHEFCPLPDELSDRLRQRRFFSRISVVWSLTYLVNVVGTVWLLTASSLDGFIMIKTLMSPILTAIAVALSYGLLRFTLRHDGVHQRWGGRALTPTAA